MQLRALGMTLLLVVCIQNALAASQYACQPTYEYNGWMSKRDITLRSSYYRGYGPSKAIAEQQALFLCQKVYRHCSVNLGNCKRTRVTLDGCSVDHGQFSGYHHDLNAAKWIVAQRCQAAQKNSYHPIDCAPIACAKLSRNQST